jgi:RNA polymerase sigma factor (sigma-70 family)
MVNAQLHGVLRYLGSLPDAQVLTESSDAQLLARFAGERDEAPFAALVRRHGPMVWSVAWRVLAHVQDAEDVFQATFLLLARKAASIRKAEAVGSWLHGVAHRLALKARLQQARRRSREKRAADMRQTKPSGETSLSEVRAALDEALGELPEKYRAALVLCYLEGQTQAEAARRLGCPLATVGTRVARGRKLLRDRLAKHGLTLSTAGLAALLIASAAPAAAPAALVKAAVQAALRFAAGQPAAALCSTRAAGLVQEGLQAMFLTKVKMATALLLAVSLIAGVTALTQRVTAGDETAKPPTTFVQPPATKEAKPPAAQKAKPPAADDKDSIAYGGRVLGPDGQPVPDAKLYLTTGVGYLKRPSPSPEYARTGPDGRFAFTVPQATFGENATIVTAAAANHGPGWVEIPAGGTTDDLSLRLVDDLPITGQIVDLEAKPIGGVTLTVLQINAAPNEDPGPWLAAVKGKKGLNPEFAFEQRYLPRFTVSPSPKVTTDAAGRFRLTGIGRNRLARVQLDGPTIASQQLYVLARPGKTIAVPLLDADLQSGTPGVAMTCYPASFRHVAGPTQPVVGVIRDKDTGNALRGVTVQSYLLANNPLGRFELVRTTTDDKGHYRLVGLPKGKGNKILVIPPDDQPYLEAAAEVPDTPGFDPVTVDFRLKRGIWIEGRLTDKATGRPAPGEVYYLARIDNTFVRDCTGYEPLHIRPTPNVQKDGTFRVAGLPGPGLLAVVRSSDHYLSARERDDEEGTRDTATKTIPDRVSTEGFQAQALIDPPPEVETFRRDVTLDPGQTLTGVVLGPDGKPLAGVRPYRLAGPRWGRSRWERSPLRTASFTVFAFNPHRPRLVLFLHPDKQLVGVLDPPADKTAPVCVRLKPGATVTGRLVDADGLPRADVELSLGIRDRSLDMWVSYYPDKVTTDRNGRFRVEALLPGQRFLLSDGRGGETYFGNVSFLRGSLRAGETKDLGDVQLKR